MAQFTQRILLIGTMVVCGSAPTVHAQSADALINKLVEKGILNVKEANELREEADKNFTTAYSTKTGMPEWVTALKFNGDLRMRYDGIYADIPGFVDRNRGRFRLRYGITASLLENFEVGFRLASSASVGGNDGGDPISTNETFHNNANRKAIGIDLAYVKWSPVDSADWTASLTLGKFENPYSMSEMLFDYDYTPEGLAEQISYHLSETHSVRVALGQFFLDETSSSSRDSFMVGAQGRIDSKWNNDWQSTLGLGALGIINPASLTSDAVPDVNKGNTRTADGVLVNDYNLIVADLGVTYSFDSAPLYSGTFPIRLAGEYVYNFGAPENNMAFGFGPTFGKSGRRGTWEFSAKYKEMQADAMYEETVDSDYGAFYPSYAAGTNVRGPVFRFSYSPYDFLTLSTMYAITELIDEVPSGRKSNGSRLIVDAVFKF